MYKELAAFFRFPHLPQEVKTYTGEVLLHIGDIPVWGYPYIFRLIRKIKPTVLVHTGDLADNLKVGRRPEDIPAYKKHAKRLIACMEKYAKEVYIVPGNNDLPDYIGAHIKKSTIIPPNTCLEIHGLSFLLCHRVLDINGEASYYLYGHGYTGDTHDFADNGKEGKFYSNANHTPALLFFESGRLIRLHNHRGGMKR